MITREDTIEKIISSYPASLPLLMKKGLCGIQCFTNESQSIGELALQKGFKDSEVELLIKEITDMINGEVIKE